jgi:DNA-binding transcriptional MerR regulator
MRMLGTTGARDEMEGMSIGEVARRAGIAPSAIRYYERLGLLPTPPRVGGKRRYDATALEWLSRIAADCDCLRLEDCGALLDASKVSDIAGGRRRAAGRR